jgi:hypothetical protein
VTTLPGAVSRRDGPRIGRWIYSTSDKSDYLTSDGIVRAIGTFYPSNETQGVDMKSLAAVLLTFFVAVVQSADLRQRHESFPNKRCVLDR